jgi:hypothetical protein
MYVWVYVCIMLHPFEVIVHADTSYLQKDFVLQTT